MPFKNLIDYLQGGHSQCLPVDFRNSQQHHGLADFRCDWPARESFATSESLSQIEQDAIASQIIETLDDEEEWTSRFQSTPAILGTLAHAALDEHRRGETRPLDELIA